MRCGLLSWEASQRRVGTRRSELVGSGKWRRWGCGNLYLGALGMIGKPLATLAPLRVSPWKAPILHRLR